MLVLAVALLFVLLFGHALGSYLRGHDPMAGEVSLLFGAATGLFVLAVSGEVLGGDAPRWLTVASSLLILLLPLLTLRLVSRFRPLPSWMMPAAALLFLLSIAPVLILGPPVRDWAAWLAVLCFATTELVASAYFGLEARERAGSAKVRLGIAGIATALFAAAVLLLPLDIANVPEVLALLSAVGYVGAFMPPRPVRTMSTMAAAHLYGRGLLSGEQQPTPQEVWRRFAVAVHELTECDAVVVLARATNAQVATEAAAGIELESEPVVDDVAFEQVNELVRQRAVHHDCPIEGPLGRRVGARYATRVPLRPPYGGSTDHVALLLSKRRSLFNDDDLDVIRDLGAQATLLAGRAEAAHEQRRLAAELGETVDALHVASKAKSDLLARVSHEFRTPLTAIIGYSALLRRSMESGDPTLAQTGPERIHSAGLHLLALVEEVLDLAQMDAGHLDLQVEDVELRDLVGRTVEELRPMATRKRLALRADVPSGAVPVDPNRMRQVLYNLLSNALKFTPPGGHVSVTAEMNEDKVRICVTDDGIGIPLEDQPRVFEEFAQVAEHGPHEGSGLGLSIARRLVAAHGGHVELESAPGEGSTFIVTLPRRREDHPPADVAVDVTSVLPSESASGRHRGDLSAAEPGGGARRQ